MISLQVLEKTFYEDAEYSLYPFAKAQTITHLNLYLYQYYQGSSDAQSTNIISLRNRINELIKVFFNLVSFYENHCQIVPPHISTHMYDVCCASFKVILRVFLKFTNRDHKRKELKNFIKQIKEHSPFFYQKIKKDRTLKMIKCLDYFGYKLCLLFTYKDALYPIFKKKIKKQK